jgi:serine/threonine protein kinase
LTLQELCTGGDLYARIPYQEADVARVLYQVLSALIYMHDRNVVHRDLYVPTG